MHKQQLHEAILKAANDLCDNAAYIGDGTAQVLTEYCNSLESALAELAKFERIAAVPTLLQGGEG